MQKICCQTGKGMFLLTWHSSFSPPSSIIFSSLFLRFELAFRHLSMESSLPTRLISAERVCSRRVLYSPFGSIVAIIFSIPLSLHSSSRTAGESDAKEFIKNIDLMMSFSVSWFWMRLSKHSSPPILTNAFIPGSKLLTMHDIAWKAWLDTSASSVISSISFGRISSSNNLFWQNGLFWASSPTSKAVSLRTSAKAELRHGRMMQKPPILKKSKTMNHH